jgi:CheY-like chemotaxis protein
MIFIVDDDQSVRTSLTRLLRSAGYDVRAFASAEECLDDDDFDPTAAPLSCVILDLHMPGMGGEKLQELIKRRDPSVPVIVLTASVDAELCASVLAAGAVKLLKKPCETMILLRAVAEALGQSPPLSPPPVTGDDAGDEETASADPDDFLLAGDHAHYRPAGSVSFDETTALVRAAIAAALRNQVRDLLVDTTALIGFPSPDTFERFLAAVEWAEEAKGGVRLAMIARPEMIHPEKFGVLVAANRGLISNIFPTEAEAREWLGI